jgi:glycosyltransferase involved in cell wall biosynthesis
VASAAGGFVDQIETGITGFLTDTSSSQQLTQTLRLVLDLSPEGHAAIRQRAYQRVVKLYDFEQNFSATLRWFWQRMDGEAGHYAS